MVVDMPPIKVAIPIGSNTLVVLMSVFRAAAIKAGINMTTIGVLFMKALKKAPKISTPRKANLGCLLQADDNKTTRGCKDPLTSMAFPIANKAQIVIRASCPKLDKKK